MGSQKLLLEEKCRSVRVNAIVTLQLYILLPGVVIAWNSTKKIQYFQSNR